MQHNGNFKLFGSKYLCYISGRIKSLEKWDCSYLFVKDLLCFWELATSNSDPEADLFYFHSIFTHIRGKIIFLLNSTRNKYGWIHNCVKTSINVPMKYELHLGGNWAQKLIHLIKKFDEKKKKKKECYKKFPYKRKEDIDSYSLFDSKESYNTTAVPQKVTMNVGHSKAFCEKQPKDCSVTSIWWLHTSVCSEKLPPLLTVRKETGEAH